MSKKVSAITLEINRPADILLPSAISSVNRKMIRDDIETFLIEEAEEFSFKENIVIRIVVAETNKPEETKAKEAIRQHFSFKEMRETKDVKRIIRTGWRSLLFSFLFLGAMFLIAMLIPRFFGSDDFIVITFRELFIILGWVALWRPADLLLYEWRSSRRRADMYGRLSRSIVKVHQRQTFLPNNY